MTRRTSEAHAVPPPGPPRSQRAASSSVLEDDLIRHPRGHSAEIARGSSDFRVLAPKLFSAIYCDRERGHGLSHRHSAHPRGETRSRSGPSGALGLRRSRGPPSSLLRSRRRRCEAAASASRARSGGVLRTSYTTPTPAAIATTTTTETMKSRENAFVAGEHLDDEARSRGPHRECPDRQVLLRRTMRASTK